MKNIFFTAAIASSLISAFFVARLMSRTNEAKILPDVGSEIRVVACSVTSARSSSMRNADLISNIVNGLPEGVHVLLLVNDRPAFKHSGDRRRVTFVEMPPESDISIWPQDPFVVVQQGDVTKLVTPCTFNREDDERMPRQLGDLLNLEVVHSELHFEGGNIVCGERKVFIGFDTIQLNAVQLDLGFDGAVTRFEKLFGRPVVVIGDSNQSIGHIDLVVTPLSHQRFAVADSRAGAEIAKKSLNNNPRQVQDFEFQCERSFFGHEEIEELLDRDGNVLSRPRVVGRTKEVIESSLELADDLDAIAAQLTVAGYQVIRVPSLIPDQQLDAEWEGESSQYPFLSYNNVLTELRDDQAIVYLPQYGFEAIDRAARDSWEQLGFDVQTIGGFSTSAMYGGALRCCTKVLLRD